MFVCMNALFPATKRVRVIKFGMLVPEYPTLSKLISVEVHYAHLLYKSKLLRFKSDKNIYMYLVIVVSTTTKRARDIKLSM